MYLYENGAGSRSDFGRNLCPTSALKFKEIFNHQQQFCHRRNILFMENVLYFECGDVNNQPHQDDQPTEYKCHS